MSSVDAAFRKHSGNPNNSCSPRYIVHIVIGSLVALIVILIIAIVVLVCTKAYCDTKNDSGTTTGAGATVMTHAPRPRETAGFRGNPSMKTVTRQPIMTREDVGDEDVVTRESIRDFFQHEGPQLMFDEEDHEGDIEPSVTFGLASRTNVPMNQEFQETLADHNTMTHKQQEKTNKQIASQSALAFMPNKTAQAMNKASKGKLKMPASLSHGSEEHGVASALASNFQDTLGQDSDDDDDDTDALTAAVAKTAANQITIGNFDIRYQSITNKKAPGGGFHLDCGLRPEVEIIFDVCEPNSSQFNGSQAHADAKERLKSSSKDITCYKEEVVVDF